MAKGKFLLPLAVAAVKRKATVIIVPLFGLSSEQVAKSVVSDHNIEA